MNYWYFSKRVRTVIWNHVFCQYAHRIWTWLLIMASRQNYTRIGWKFSRLLEAVNFINLCSKCFFRYVSTSVNLSLIPYFNFFVRLTCLAFNNLLFSMQMITRRELWLFLLLFLWVFIIIVFQLHHVYIAADFPSVWTMITPSS